MDCSQLRRYCSAGYSVNSRSVLELCPRTCGICGRKLKLHFFQHEILLSNNSFFFTEMPPPPPPPVRPCYDYAGFNCPSLAQFCNSNAMLNGYLITQVCPFTCKLCGLSNSSFFYRLVIELLHDRKF
jgi:hypothetical protein